MLPQRLAERLAEAVLAGDQVTARRLALEIRGPCAQVAESGKGRDDGPRDPISLRAYAKRRGVSPVAVSKAVKRGRLRASVVTVDGQPKIADPEIADREWEENTRRAAPPPEPG